MKWKRNFFDKAPGNYWEYLESRARDVSGERDDQYNKRVV